MGKTSNKYVCSECGYVNIKWLGKCPSCNNWNTLLEENVSKKSTNITKKVDAIPLTNITNEDVLRVASGIGELDRVLGGGIVPGSLVLIGGDPGIGKSTILLQVADSIGKQNKKVLYLSGEEALKQIRLRSLRLNINNKNIYLLNEQNIELLELYLEDINPDLIIIDSIQTVYSENISSIPGSVSQLRECTAKIMEIAKSQEKAFFVVGHITKDGVIAGPKVLEHMVDVVIYFEGEKNFAFRLLRGVKNRFGSTDEIGLMEMRSQGLVEVENPSYFFLSDSDSNASGTSVVASFEGSRPLLIEAQALVTPTGQGYPRRMTSGIDQNRLALIIAVLEKRAGINLAMYDVYIKITGGVFLKDPSIDLGLAAAIISSYRDEPLSPGTVFIGELGLSGDIRSVPSVELRLKEIQKLGFNTVVMPISSSLNKEIEKKLNIIQINNIDDLIHKILEGQ
ncbi:DNA repair protein RadA [Candidatus Syntrophocurvum alkaliphilum]|uniref:DNA repair protein RadA n=1 Tax=Candidatus Syntrophocurvum alkaliphilum TaxID=2293317 RepID=A0A6I6DLS4_9FIRM|nr:DNA repair protein RadA [Candidatus Syntrophocurvum alkaliphilum]QGU00747.1 DNA repair protein RadA [Candidatus Syntrophocurvum alkaliphilum]